MQADMNWRKRSCFCIIMSVSMVEIWRFFYSPPSDLLSKIDHLVHKRKTVARRTFVNRRQAIFTLELIFYLVSSRARGWEIPSRCRNALLLQYHESYLVLGYLVLDPFLYAIESAVAMEHAAGGEERLGAQLTWVFIRGLKKKENNCIWPSECR